MGEQLLAIYNSLPESGQQEAYDFVMYLSSKWKNNSSNIDDAKKVMAAFNEAKVCIPVNWTREEINERA